MWHYLAGKQPQVTWCELYIYQLVRQGVMHLKCLFVMEPSLAPFRAPPLWGHFVICNLLLRLRLLQALSIIVSLSRHLCIVASSSSSASYVCDTGLCELRSALGTSSASAMAVSKRGPVLVHLHKQHCSPIAITVCSNITCPALEHACMNEFCTRGNCCCGQCHVIATASGLVGVQVLNSGADAFLAALESVRSTD